MDGHNKEPKLHLLLVSFVAQGLINPLLQLAMRLSSKRVQVTFATSETAGHLMRQATTLTTATTNPLLQFRFFSDGWDLDINTYFSQLNEVGPKNLTQLITDLSSQNNHVSCIISNPFLPWVIQVAEAEHIPCALLWTQPYSVFAIYYRYLRDPDQLPTQTQPGSLRGFPNLGFQDLPSYLIPPYSYSLLTEALSQTFKNMERFKWVLVNSFMELETDVIESIMDSPPVIFTGPLVPSSLLRDCTTSWNVRGDMWKPCNDCIPWLDAQLPSSVVYVSFGSWVVRSQEQMEELALGLERSGRPFLWVVKDCCLPNGFLDRTEGVGKVVRWCLQVEVLCHVSVACFLTHCGWNSTLESVSTGVPVIAFPDRGDQITNAKLLVDVYGMGVRMKSRGGGIVGKEEVKRCIDEVMEGPRAGELKMNALRWKNMAGDAGREGGSSEKNIQGFIDDVSVWSYRERFPRDGEVGEG